MKQLFSFIGSIFKKKKTYSSLISDAIAEGMRDTLKEMGYGFDGKKSRKDTK